ncbi:hypothetical protein [Spirosoma taeanense]|nr:hypothetical protein [Spirosoma taeanense]
MNVTVSLPNRANGWCRIPLKREFVEKVDSVKFAHPLGILRKKVRLAAVG